MVLERVPALADLEEWKRRAIGYLGLISTALVVTALGYRWGMATFEGRPRTFL